MTAKFAGLPYEKQPMTPGTGSSNATIYITADGYYTVPAPVECEACKEQMQPIAWLCGRCGGAA